jgi:uncharacterized membrane protein YraQ (UPF0718 family)
MKMLETLKRYRAALVAAVVLLTFILVFPNLAPKVGDSLLQQTKTMLLVIPPIFLLLGLLDAWVPRETLMKYMGPGSGVKGRLIAFTLGSAAAGPLYGAFPMAAVLMKKGASFSNILIFIGSWSTTKIPMLLFEMKALGFRFALARLAIDIPGIILIALALKAVIPQAEVDRLYAAAEAADLPQRKA